MHLDTAGLPAGQVRDYGPSGETGFSVSSGANSYTDVAAIPAHLVHNPADGTFTLAFYLNSATDTFGAPNDSGRMNLSVRPTATATPLRSPTRAPRAPRRT